jgi:hypothetical protein
MQISCSIYQTQTTFMIVRGHAVVREAHKHLQESISQQPHRTAAISDMRSCWHSYGQPLVLTLPSVIAMLEKDARFDAEGMRRLAFMPLVDPAGLCTSTQAIYSERWRPDRALLRCSEKVQILRAVHARLTITLMIWVSQNKNIVISTADVQPALA